MAVISPAVPTLGDPNATEDPDIRNAIIAILNEFNGSIDDANIKSSAGIQPSKLANATAGKLYIANGSGVITATAMAGDVAIDSAGNTTIQPNAVDTTKMADGAVTAPKTSGLSTVPPGAIFPYVSVTPPSGYFLCNGGAINRTTFSALFAVIGTTYGAGDGSTTFNLPDLRGRVPVGVDNATGRVTSNNTLGATSGEEKHTLTVGELAQHNHYATNTSAGGPAPFVRSVSGAGVSSSVSNLSDTSGDTGSNTPHNNMQPYQVVWFIIKT